MNGDPVQISMHSNLIYSALIHVSTLFLFHSSMILTTMQMRNSMAKLVKN